MSTDFCDFMRERVGPNWVMARRTPRIVRQYGDDVVTVSPQRYKQLKAEHQARVVPGILKAAAEHAELHQRDLCDCGQSYADIVSNVVIATT